MTTIAANSSGRKSAKDRKLNQGKPTMPPANPNSVSEIINNQPEEFKSKNDKFQPTAEQMRIASLMSDKKDEKDDLKPKIEQIVELTGASKEDAAVALYDCDNDMAKAIEMILDGEALDSEWQSTGRKKKSKAPIATTATSNNTTTEVLTNGNKKADKSTRFNQKNASNSTAPSGKSQRGGGGAAATAKNRKKDANRETRGEFAEESDVFSGANAAGDFKEKRGGAKRGGRGGGGGGGGARGTRGKGPGGAGRGTRTFMNRGLQANDTFSNSIETWTNSTAEQSKITNDDINTMTVGNWADVAPTEEWSEEDWTSAHMETKVFTPSSKVIPEKEETHSAQNAAAISYLSNKNEPANQQPTMSAILSGNLNKQRPSASTPGQALLQQIQQQSSTSQNSNLNQYALNQYSKQATESIKSLVGLSSNNMIAAGDMIGSSEHGLENNLATKQSPQLSSQNRIKVPNRNTKIPDSAVEMPSNDPIKNLALHFGSLEFGNNSFPISGADSNLFDSVSHTTGKKVDNKTLLPSSSDASNANSNFRTGNSSNAGKPILQNPVLTQSLNESILNADHRDKNLNQNHYNSKAGLDRKSNDYMSYKGYAAAADNSYSAYPSTGYYTNANQAFGNSTASQSLMANNVYNANYNNSKMRDMDSSVQQQVAAAAAVSSGSSSSSKPYDAATTVGAPLSLMSNSTVTTNALKNSMSAGKGMHSAAPPGVQQTPVLSPYLMGNTAPGLPIHHYPYTPYDVQFPQTPRDHGYSAYAAADVKYNRGNESEMLPVSSQAGGAVQSASQAHNQPYVNAYPPGYGFYFGLNFAQGLYNPAQHALYPVAQPQTTASAGSTFPKANSAANYGSHSYNSAYDSLGAVAATQDFVNKSYSQQMQQHKQMSGNNANDLSGSQQQSMYSKAHSQLNKSYDKQNFQTQAPQFNMSNTAQSAAANMSSTYGSAYLLPHQQQQMHHSLVSGGGGGVGGGASGDATQQPGVGGNQRSMSQAHKASAGANSVQYSKFNSSWS